MNFSNSTTDKTESLKDTNSLAIQWETIDWSKVEIEVNRLQTRIAKATADGKRNKAKRLQYLLTHSFTAKAFAVRKVTTNKGKNTPGVERFFRSLKYEKLYLTGYHTVEDVYEAVKTFIAEYNHERPHQSLGYQYPSCHTLKL